MGNYLSKKDINKLENDVPIKTFTGSAETNWMIYGTAIKKADKLFESYLDQQPNYKGWRCVVVERRKLNGRCTWNANMIIQYNYRKKLYHLSMVYLYKKDYQTEEMKKIGKTPVLGRTSYHIISNQ